MRNTIERIFGIFKSRFTIFKIAPPFPYDTQAELVLACAGLHNFLRKECRSDEFPEEQDNEGSSSSPIPVNEEDNFEPVFETQEEQREHANQWRDAIAANMWNDVERFNNNEQYNFFFHNNKVVSTLKMNFRCFFYLLVVMDCLFLHSW